MTSLAPPAAPGFAKKSPPRPSSIYPVLWHFACERHQIYLRRIAHFSPPWTTDPVLSAYKFTNTFRAADRVSQYLIRVLYSEPHLDADTIFLRTLLLKVFNRIGTWERVVDHFGMPTANDFSFAECQSLLDRYRRDKVPLYSAAYIMPSGGRSSTPKHHMHLHLIRQMLEDHLPDKLLATTSMEDAYHLLLAYPTLGPFLSFQYTIDLNYTTLMNHLEGDFVVAGPGALDGLSKCFITLGDYGPEGTIRWLVDRQQEEFSRHSHDFDGLWGRPLQPIDVQNLLCEVSKYTRITHPNVTGRMGRKRIKQRFRVTGEVPAPVFPPDWGLRERIDSWLRAQASHAQLRTPSFRLTTKRKEPPYDNEGPV